MNNESGGELPAGAETSDALVPFLLHDRIPVDDDSLGEVDVVVDFYSLVDNVSFAEAEQCKLLHRLDGPAVVAGRDEEWFAFGQLHRDDGPALTYYDGDRGRIEVWHCHGVIHREDGPAIEIEDGHREWIQNGKLHRGDDLPALISADGTLEWHCHGKLHRDLGRPAFVSASGKGVGWWKHGLQHGPGNDLPACIDCDGTMQWFEDGQLHRFGGPALVGDGRWSWLIRGQEQRPGGLPTSCWHLGDRHLIEWSRPGADGGSVSVAELAIPDYGEPACLTVFSTGPGEVGSFYTTCKGIAFILVGLGLNLDELMERDYPRLSAEIKAARLWHDSDDPVIDPFDVAEACEDREVDADDSVQFKRIYALR
jgi:hypothetical protein